MNNNKSPGSDGLTTEFYKLFWKDIKTPFLSSIHYSYENGKLTELQTQGIISLLPKKNKNLLVLSNWRPISLLNVDYKIISKVISNRIKKVLPSIINSSQTGFLKGRYIGENIRTIIEIIENANNNDTPGMIFFADFEKAFDSIDHSFMYKCLEKFNFGTSFIKYVKLLYNDAKSCITNNGFLSDFFKIERGVRQGCPLSPYLFICAIEFLYNYINKNEDIKGINIENNEIKYTAFADDATWFINGTKQSFDNLVKTIDDFSKMSGLNLNSSKSIILKIGSSKRNNEAWCNGQKFIWTIDKANTLGITFTNDKDLTLNINFQEKITEFNKCLDRWKIHNLSLIGKITAIKTFAFPKLIYPLTVLDLPSRNTLKVIKTKTFNFLWDGKPEKIKRDTIIQSYENGGLNMIDIDLFIQTLKCSWIKRLADPNNKGNWKKLYLEKLAKLGGLDFFKCNISPADSKCLIKNSFLTDIIYSWASITYQENIRNIVSSQIIWNNSLIKHEGKLFCNLEWEAKGIKTIDQIYDSRLKSFLTFEAMKLKFHINNADFLKYYQILSSIPRSWKKYLKEEQNENPTVKLYELMAENKVTNQTLKNTQLQRINLNNEIKPQKQWESIFTHINWKAVYSMPFRSTIDTKLRAFQYKYNMRIYPTNDFLYKCQIKDSSLCDFCNMYSETIQHLFWECPMVQSF